ncbi:unnamed protein product [Caenorhabditis angaria]|uniref:CHK kinase-like domain-containing protein n=1 Tax=Caenorhabditis angaria TaxID=860376 RepID=A0A9P1IRT8_9PELO|nr:unnamed protein product [Caenorhabditis angaria]
MIPRISENANRCETIDADNMHNLLKKYSRHETNFYNLLKNRPVPHFPTAHIYYIEEVCGAETDAESGGMVAEDLVGQVHAIDFLPGLNEAQVLALMEALAGLHWITLRDLERESDFADFPEQSIFTDRLQVAMYDEAVLLEQICPEKFGNSRIQNLAWSFDYDYKTAQIQKLVQKLGRKILVHGDLNVSNILWRNAAPNEIAAIIDYQFVHVGSIAADIVRVLTLGVSRAHRKEHTDRYLKYYWQKLDELTKSDKMSNVLSFNELKEQYWETFAISSNFTLFGIGLYHKMYSDGSLGKAEKRAENLRELLDRAEGIVEDIENLARK